MRVHFTNFELPEGDEVYVYGTSPDSRVVGPYTGRGRFATMRARAGGTARAPKGVAQEQGFWTGTIPGDTVIIEHYAKGAGGSFDVAEVAHHYEAFLSPSTTALADVPGTPLGCHTDANCVDDPVLNDLKDAVAKIVFALPNGKMGRCSGTLINTKTDEGFEPYFLTARHCVSNNDVALTVDTYWAYRSTYCNSGQPDAGIFVEDAGALVLNTEQSSDQTLLRLLTGVPDNATYAGWTTADFDLAPLVYGLHHPRGSYLRLSAGTIFHFNTEEDCADSGLEDGWEVTWGLGLIEKGSSGSGLFLPDGKLIGVASCSDGSCKGSGYYGKFRDFYGDIATFLQLGDNGLATANVLQANPSFNVQDALTTNDVAARVYGAGFYGKQYRFYGLAGQRVIFNLHSDQFDAYLSLLSPVDRELLAEDDDDGEGSNARLITTLQETGEYIVEVSSFDELATGAFTFSGNLGCSFTLSETQASFPSTISSGNFAVYGQTGCVPVIKSKPSWIDAKYDEPDGRVYFQMTANLASTARTGEIVLGAGPGVVTSAFSPTFKVTQAALSCSFTLSAQQQSFPNTISSGNFTVNGQTGCAPVIKSLPAWIDAHYNEFTGKVYFQMAGNPSASERTGDIVIGLASGIAAPANSPAFKVTQAPCAVTIPLVPVSFPRQGGQNNFQVSTTCGSWAATSQSSWIKIVSGASGSGNGTVTYSVDPNTTSGISPRTGTIQIYGKIFTIEQQANACLPFSMVFGQTVNGELGQVHDCYSIVGPGARYADRYLFVGAAGQPVAITMNSTEVNSYLRLIGPTGAVIATGEDIFGSTNARIPASRNFALPASGTYVIEATVSPTVRPDTGKYTLSLNTGCGYTLSHTNHAVRAAGGTGNFTVATTSNCPWTVSSDSLWISISLPNIAGGTGNGTVNYTVAANPSSQSRTGTITVSGVKFTVQQAGKNP